ncbi:MAG: DUF5809 family protein [Halanaeroarchaeum sp.]
METRGLLSPATESDVREEYEALGPAAQVVTKEVAKAMDLDREEYRERVTSAVVETARDALFASLLRVHLGDRTAFESWLADHPDLEPHLGGSDAVDNRAWHPVPAAGAVAVVTYQQEPDAAVGTVQRQAFGRYYRDLL